MIEHTATAASLPREGRFLIIEAAWPRAAVGIWENGRWHAFLTTEGPAVEALFATIEVALKNAGIRLTDIDGFVYGEGPGSILGLRTAAMALRAWNALPGVAARPTFLVNSLALAAALAEAEGGARATVFAASRRDRWNVLTPESSTWAECDPTGLAETPMPRLRLPARDLGAPPVDAATFDPVDALAKYPEILLHHKIFRVGAAPDAANLANTYAAWTGDRHKA